MTNCLTADFSYKPASILAATTAGKAGEDIKCLVLAWAGMHVRIHTEVPVRLHRSVKAGEILSLSTELRAMLEQAKTP